MENVDSRYDKTIILEVQFLPGVRYESWLDLVISDIFFKLNDYIVPEEHYFSYIVLDIKNRLDLFYLNV